MNGGSEMARLAAGGPAPDTADGAGGAAREAGDLAVVAASFADPGAGWERVHAVLEVMAAPRRPWPTASEWKELLPRWFVDECSDDVTIVNCALDKWSVRAWVYWFQPDQRRWTFWSRRIEGSRLELAVAPTGQGSLLLGSLEWLLKSAGGTLLREA